MSLRSPVCGDKVGSGPVGMTITPTQLHSRQQVFQDFSLDGDRFWSNVRFT